MKNKKQVELDGKTYVVGCLTTTAALKLLTRITKIVGAPMATMSMASAGSELETLLPKAITILSEKLEPEEFLSIVKELMRCVTLDNKMLNIDTDLDLKTTLLLCKEAMEVNYEDFLSEVMSLVSSENPTAQQ